MHLENENKKKENVENNSQGIRSSSEALTPSHLFFTGTHTSKEAISTKGAAGESQSKEKTKYKSFERCMQK